MNFLKKPKCLYLIPQHGIIHVKPIQILDADQFIDGDKLNYYINSTDRTGFMILRDKNSEQASRYRYERYHIHYQSETWVLKNKLYEKHRPTFK